MEANELVAANTSHVKIRVRIIALGLELRVRISVDVFLPCKPSDDPRTNIGCQQPCRAWKERLSLVQSPLVSVALSPVASREMRLRSDIRRRLRCRRSITTPSPAKTQERRTRCNNERRSARLGPAVAATLPRGFRPACRCGDGCDRETAATWGKQQEAKSTVTAWMDSRRL